jgi:hypothetical protein
MRRSPGRTWDTTGDSAVGDVAGDSLLVEVFARIEDERDRVLILAHIGLDISLRNLARAMGVSRTELSDRVSAIIARLREDVDLGASLADIHRAGSNDRYQALVFRLGLQDWFCSYCGGFMLQSEFGAERRTCSDKCRYRLWKAGGISWKNDQFKDASPNGSQPAPNLLQAEPTDSTYRERLLALIRPIEAGERLRYWGSPNTFWCEPETRCRDRALLLLGFMCPIPISSSDLAALDIDDISKHPNGLEVRLYRRTTRTRYVIISTDIDSRLCPVTSIWAWRTRLVRTGRTSGPLFIRMGSKGQLPEASVRLTGQSIANVISNAVYYAREDGSYRYPELKRATLLPGFLKGITTRTP